MWRYLIRRTIYSALVVLGIITITFFLVHLAPGDPLAYYVSPKIKPEIIAQIRSNLGLDEPIIVQYIKWISSFFKGDFGFSLAQQRPVIDILKEAIPATLLLTLFAFIVDIVVGSFVGIVSAIRRNSVMDHSLGFLSLFIYSMPSFWLSLMLIFVFSLNLGWLPSSQMASPNIDYLGFWQVAWDRLRHLILPVTVLGITSAASTARYMRSSMLEVLSQDYIRTARAKGLPERIVIMRHALKNALLPIATLVGLNFPFLLGGAVIIETIFAWPGMGRITVDAIFLRDYPVVMATNFIAAGMVVIGNLFSDVFYTLIDPRIRYE